MHYCLSLTPPHLPRFSLSSGGFLRSSGLLVDAFTHWATGVWLWKPDPAYAVGDRDCPGSAHQGQDFWLPSLTLETPCWLPACLAVWLFSFTSISAGMSSLGKLQGSRAVLPGVLTSDGDFVELIFLLIFSLFRDGDLIKGNDFALVPKYLRARLLFRLL